jgi:pyruvoyl-dependent arginine decarboxylase (PvlArgDC)
LTKVDINKKAMIEALTQSLGIVTSACKAVGISRTLHYNWYNEDAEYKKAVDEVADIAIDFAETMLHQRIKEQDTTATIFYLKTKGKKRGYIERQEFDATINIPILPSIIIKTNE